MAMPGVTGTMGTMPPPPVPVPGPSPQGGQKGSGTQEQARMGQAAVAEQMSEYSECSVLLCLTCCNGAAAVDNYEGRCCVQSGNMSDTERACGLFKILCLITSCSLFLSSGKIWSTRI